MIRRHCVFCEREVEAWLPFTITEADVSPFLWRVGITGSNVRRFWCPHCRSIDRERHLKLFFDRLGIWNVFGGAAILHMAPESVLGSAIRNCRPSRYVMGDLAPRTSAVEKIDLEAIAAPSGGFDVVICNHILEHVNFPQAALSEVRRVLRKNGRFICQTPFAARLSTTLEDPLLQSPNDRLFFYGQDNHLRLFGIDIETTIRDAGFSGVLRPHGELLADIDPEEFGVNELEPFFDFVRS